MTTAEGSEDRSPTDEQFVHTVKSRDVLEADDLLWSAFSTFLGRDPVEAWTLIEVTHTPQPETDDEGKPTGDWVLVSTATWKRDPEHPTPDRVVTIAAELPDDDEEVSAGGGS